MDKILDVDEQHIGKQKLFAYILFAYLFSVSIRYILYYNISEDSNYFYNGEIIPLWNPDSGLYGFYANKLLSGVSYPLETVKKDS